MNLKSEVTATMYILPLPESIWEALTAVDVFGEEDKALALISDLEKLGAYGINWSGHFGMAIFFSLEESDVSPDALKSIENYMKNLT